MRFLREDFGESEELNTFVAQIERRFGTYYTVTLVMNGKESNKHFAFESAGKKYYQNLKNEAEKNKEYYDGAQISFKKIEVLRDEDELEWTMIDDSDEDIESEETIEGDVE